MPDTASNLRLIQAFLECMHAERNASQHTISAYAKDLELFSLSLPEKLTLNQATTDHLKTYLVHLKNIGKSPATQNRKLSCLRQFYQFLYTENLIDKRITDNLYSPKKQKTQPETLTPDEVSLLISAASGDDYSSLRTQAILSLLYASGLRISELLNLKIKDFQNLDTTSFKRVHNFIVKGKGRKDRLVFIHSKCQKILASYIKKRLIQGKKQSNPFLFPGKNNQPLTRQHIFGLLKKIVYKTSLDRKKISPHTLRHAFASHLLNQGVDLVSLQKLLGHTNIATTQIYTTLLSQEIFQTIQKHPLANNRATPLCKKSEKSN